MMSKRAERYLKMIGQTQDASVILTKGFAKAADELKNLGMAEFIPISSGGVHVALTRKGLNVYAVITEA
jgi:hypothetical protein